MNANNGNSWRSFVTHLVAGEETVLDLDDGTKVVGHMSRFSKKSSGDSPSVILLHRRPSEAAAQCASDWVAAAKALPGTAACYAPVDSDGNFSLSGVTPGFYEYSFDSYQVPPECAAGTVVVPEVAPNETFKMTDFVSSVVQTLKAGDVAPVELGRTADGKLIHCGDFAGKYIVWIVWDEMGTDRSADWARLESDLGDEKDVAFVADNVGLSYGETYGAPWRQPATIAQVGWTNGYLSTVDHPLFQSLEYFKQNREVICLIDPAGKIRAMNLTPEQVKESFDQLEKAAVK
jgi:hypothetical protein